MQFRTKLLSSTVLAAAAMVLAVPTASAQDIGALEKRVKALEKSGGGKNVTRTKKTVGLVISGHVFRAIQFRDNGTTSGFLHVTPNSSRSRVRWIGTGKVNDDLTVQTVIELGHQSSIATAQDLSSGGAVGNTVLDERVFEVRLKSKSLGTVYLGQGYRAASGSYNADFSGTGLLSINAFAELVAGGEDFQNNGTAVGASISQAFSNFDRSRDDRVRYDTPKFAGFQVRVDHENSDSWGVGLYYGGSIGGVKIAARISHNDFGGTTANDLSFVNGSFSVLLPMGLSLTVAGGDQDAGNVAGTTVKDTQADQADWRYAKVGYKFNALELGQTRLYVDYSHHKNNRALDEDATSWSFGVVQIIEPLGMEAILGYHNFDLDRAAGADSDDIDVVTMGLRAKF